MSEIRRLTRNGETFYPLTHIDGVIDRDGNQIEINDIFDISEYNASGDPLTPAEYSTLSLALAAIPLAKQKGGMSIRYIESSGHTYQQYRLSSSTFNTTTGNWISENIDNVPTASSDNLVKSGGVAEELALGGVYDVSAHNGGTTFASLSALLSDANLGTYIPTSVRKGGMSIKFVQTSDNNYVKFFCTAQNFTTDVTQWQGIDDDALICSENEIATLNSVRMDNAYEVSYTSADFKILLNGTFNNNRANKHIYLPVTAGEIYHIDGIDDYTLRVAFATTNAASANGNVPVVAGTSVYGISPNVSIWMKIPDGCTYLLLWRNDLDTGFIVKRAVSTFVGVSPQILTDEQKTQALNNIGAGQAIYQYNKIPFSSSVGSIRGSDGSAQSAPDSRMKTGYIDITRISNILYTRVCKSSTSAPTLGLAFYDSEKHFIPNSSVLETNSDHNGYVIDKTVVPNGAVYVRFTYWKNEKQGIFFFCDADTDGLAKKIKEVDSLKEDVESQTINNSILYNDLANKTNLQTLDIVALSTNRSSYLYNNGTIVSGSTTYGVRKFSIEENKVYLVSGRVYRHANACLCCFYDDNDIFLESYINSIGVSKDYENIAIIAPSNAAFVRVQFYNSETVSLKEYLVQQISFDPYDKPDNIGVYNALLKAAQLSTIKWTPKGRIPYNQGTYQPNIEKTGMIYSSVAEYSQFVAIDVSFETFMTAVNNPRSVVYTENVNKDNSTSAIGRTYHRGNCAAYYGTVCSGLIAYAYGLPMNITTTEIPGWDEMEKVDDQSAYGIKLADSLLMTGHIRMVTGIKRDKNNLPVEIEITEAAQGGVITTVYSDVASFNEILKEFGGNYVIYRYKKLYENREYTPQNQFVAVGDETLVPYTYNDDICPNYGEKANYIEGDNVVLNLRTDYADVGFTTLEVYKDDVLLESNAISGIDETLSGLSYGTYKARLTGSQNSEYCHFIVVNATVVQDGSSFSFASANATPTYYEFCNITGSKSHDIEGISTRRFTASELTAGVATPYGEIIATNDFPYLKVHFATDYGRAIKVILWTI